MGIEIEIESMFGRDVTIDAGPWFDVSIPVCEFWTPIQREQASVVQLLHGNDCDWWVVRRRERLTSL